MNDEIEIVIDDNAKEIGLAELIGNLIKDNCIQNEKKRQIFTSLKGEVLITAKDAEVSILLSFMKGRLLIKKGESRTGFHIKGSSDSIISLSNTRLFLGFPSLLNRNGFELLKSLLKKDIEIEGLKGNISFGIKLLRIISID